MPYVKKHKKRIDWLDDPIKVRWPNGRITYRTHSPKFIARQRKLQKEVEMR